MKVKRDKDGRRRKNRRWGSFERRRRRREAQITRDVRRGGKRKEGK